MNDWDEDLLIQTIEYLWELKCLNEWRWHTTAKNIKWLEDLQDCIDELQKKVSNT